MTAGEGGGFVLFVGAECGDDVAMTLCQRGEEVLAGFKLSSGASAAASFPISTPAA